MYLANSSKDPSLNFFYLIEEGSEGLFDKLSKRIPNKETYKLLSIRKSPFINVGLRKYLISDNSFLLEKTYSQFLNDFWFDRIKKIADSKGNLKFTIKDYRSEFGYFFEGYISELLHQCFDSYKHSTLLLFEQLRIKSIKGEIEIADVYLRYNNKVLIGEVKSGSIYDTEKYGGTIESLYKRDRNEFFKNFGVNQLVESIKKMEENGLSIDSKFPKGHSYQVYPCIFVNDKSLQTPLMADTFNKRFQELIMDLQIRKVKVNKLTIIHISDIERLEDFLKENPKDIWTILELNGRSKFVPPFYNSVNKTLDGRKYADRIMKLFSNLILKYNPSDSSKTDN